MVRRKIEKRTNSPVIEYRTNRSRLVAAFLAIFFGYLGIHKFYLGKPWWGLAYLLLVWSFISFIISIMEGISYLLMSDKEFQNKYS